MRKTLLALALAVTGCNLALGAYAAVCESTGGSRACGTTCAGGTNGACKCEGTCTAEELRWVDGANGGGGGDEEIIVE